MAKRRPIEEQWEARHRFARISPRKVRLVMAVIRGLPCNDALAQLSFNGRRASGMIRDVLKSAMANAGEQDADLRALYVCEARVDGGPYFRRWRPKDRGRAHPIAKRTSHIVIKLAER
jgi:large subunit ribosomal protein L22